MNHKIIIEVPCITKVVDRYVVVAGTAEEGLALYKSDPNRAFHIFTDSSVNEPETQVSEAIAYDAHERAADAFIAKYYPDPADADYDEAFIMAEYLAGNMSIGGVERMARRVANECGVDDLTDPSVREVIERRSLKLELKIARDAIAAYMIDKHGIDGYFKEVGE